MNDPSPELLEQRSIEDRALRLGRERKELEKGLDAIMQQTIDLLDEASAHGVPLDRIAHLIGVSRQTVYRWRDVVARLRANAQD